MVSAPALAFAQDKATSGTAGLQKVASFDHQVTGIALAETGRIFVNFPRWSEDAPVSLAELTPDGKLHPYPNEEWNRYRNAAPLTPGDHFVCVQAETADGHGSLWVIDPAAPNTEAVVAGGPKLVKIDLATNSVTRTFTFRHGCRSAGQLPQRRPPITGWQGGLHHRFGRVGCPCRR